MIVAVILAVKSGDEANIYFDGAPGESRIERVAAAVLRGPFGGVLAAAHPQIDARIREKLNGFAVKFVAANQARNADDVRAAGLKAAADFRARWEQARAAAAGRFGATEGQDWSKHKQHADVKIRGLARSFDRDGVLLVPADAHNLTKEKLAELIEKFAQQKGDDNLIDAEFVDLELLKV